MPARFFVYNKWNNRFCIEILTKSLVFIKKSGQKYGKRAFYFFVCKYVNWLRENFLKKFNIFSLIYSKVIEYDFYHLFHIFNTSTSGSCEIFKTQKDHNTKIVIV